VAYATPNDMMSRYPNRDLVQLSNEDPTQTTVDTDVLQQVLNDASAEIDGYIEGRFSLPVSDPPELLNRLASDIAMYRLQSLRPVHDLADTLRGRGGTAGASGARPGDLGPGGGRHRTRAGTGVGGDKCGWGRERRAAATDIRSRITKRLLRVEDRQFARGGHRLCA